MSIANTVKDYLAGSSIDYELISHTHTQSSMDSAGAAHVTGERLAKAVIVKEDETYLMVVVPSDHHVHMGRLHHLLGQEVGLATEQELVSLFPDCEGGAIPPLGRAYHLKTLVDSSLLDQSEIYFESGDHQHLVKVSGEHFSQLLSDADPVHLLTRH
jgi:Ala-tRNA(Pro) deacylase